MFLSSSLGNPERKTSEVSFRKKLSLLVAKQNGVNKSRKPLIIQLTQKNGKWTFCHLEALREWAREIKKKWNWGLFHVVGRHFEGISSLWLDRCCFHHQNNGGLDCSVEMKRIFFLLSSLLRSAGFTTSDYDTIWEMRFIFHSGCRQSIHRWYIFLSRSLKAGVRRCPMTKEWLIASGQ